MECVFLQRHDQISEYLLLFLYTCQPLPEIFRAVRIFVVCRARDLEMMGNAFAFYVNITGNIFVRACA